MPDIIRTQAIFDRVSGMTEDRVVNTFHMVSNGTLSTDLTNIQDNIADFYAAVDGVLFTNQSLVSTYTLKSYSLSDPLPRTPLAVSSRGLTMTTGPALPAEVALCLSYRQLPVSGVPLGQQRGRIFLGPLATAVLGTAAVGDARPVASTMTTLRTAGQALANACSADGVFWGVWSPTALTHRQIEEVSTDDAFDTQRRRGADPTARTRLLV